MDCSPPGSSVHGILQARILEWVAMPSFGVSSQPRDRIHISYGSYVCRQVVYIGSERFLLNLLICAFSAGLAFWKEYHLPVRSPSAIFNLVPSLDSAGLWGWLLHLPLKYYKGNKDREQWTVRLVGRWGCLDRVVKKDFLRPWLSCLKAGLL